MANYQLIRHKSYSGNVYNTLMASGQQDADVIMIFRLEL